MNELTRRERKEAWLKLINRLRYFISRSQIVALTECVNGPEGESFLEKMTGIANLIEGMPKSYEQDGKGDKAIVSLHYFNSSMDWFITEKDAGDSDDEVKGVQSQAFGLADLYHDGGELGYICIADLIKDGGAELDLYFPPQSLGEIKKLRNAK